MSYICISGFDIRTNNRGTAALGYGSVSFLHEKGLLNNGDTLVSFHYINNPLKKRNRGITKSVLSIQGLNMEHITVHVHRLEKKLFDKWGILLPFSNFRKYLRKIEYVAAINGGDGFSDIYGTKSFLGRLHETHFAMRLHKPLIILPQTVGPFEKEENRCIAESVLKYAQQVYVRDDKYVQELNRIGVKHEITKDLSYYMKPEPFDIDIKKGAVGINVSGLAYSNKFRTLSGQFDNYPYLIDQLIKTFQKRHIPVYLIPHSYNSQNPELNGDDMLACKEAYNRLENKDNVFFIDKDLISPQIKYVISQMFYFIGTRMHANFAAIYTGIPVYGLAYSYKFEGAFRANGVFDDNISLINNITSENANSIVKKIISDYDRHK